MKKIVLIISLILNIVFISMIFYVINQKGGISFIKEKIGYESKPIYTAHYYEKKSLFEVLPKDSCSVVFLGNSITEGCEWSELFNNTKIKNRGIGGDDTEGVLNRLHTITSIKPSKIFIMIGINDFSKGRKIIDILSNYEKIVRTIQTQSPTTSIYIQSLLPVDERKNKSANNTNIRELNLALKELSNKYKIVFIDLYPLFISNDVIDTTMSSDGVHLMGSAYLKWKQAIIQYLK